MIIIKNVFGGSQVYIKSIYNDVDTVIVYNGGDPIEIGGGGGGVTDHGALTGLADDDHTQYHNDARGDARYNEILVSGVNIRTINSSSILGSGDIVVGSTAWGDVTGTLSDQTDLNSALTGKADSSHTHPQSDITNLTTDLGNKVTANGAITGATKAKITYDAKGLVTSGADLVEADIPTLSQSKITNLTTDLAGKAATSHTHAQSDITNLTTDLAAKQATLVSGTNIKTLDGVTLLGTSDLTAESILLKTMRALGANFIAQTWDLHYSTTTAFTLVNQELDFTAIYIPYDTTITGVQWLQTVNGSYTANNYNGVGLYSYSGGTLTLVASSTDDGNIWQQGGTGKKSKAFSSTYAATAGVYFIATLYCRSAQTTAPTIASKANMAAINTLLTNSAKLSGYRTSQTSLNSPSVASSSLTEQSLYPWVAVY